MNNESIIQLAKDFPKSQCLHCTAFDGKVCNKGLTIPCGRNFDPKGGDKVPV